MTSKYDADFQTKQEPEWHNEPPLPRWNTYGIRTALKGLSGLLFALSFLPIILRSWTVQEILALPFGFVTFTIAFAIWIIFYRLELQYRARTPERVL